MSENLYKFIKFSKSENSHIWTLSLNRRKKMDAVSFDSLGEIAHFILNHVNPWSSEARVLVLKAEGKHFTAGLDLDSVDLTKDDDSDPARIALKQSDSLEIM